jgi:hypothetical protein
MEKKKKPQREEISLFIGGERSWKPRALDGRTFYNAVQVVVRTDLHAIVEYAMGWALTADPDSREATEWIPRSHVGHADLAENLRLLTKAKEAIEGALERSRPPKQQPERGLTFRMVLRDK